MTSAKESALLEGPAVAPGFTLVESLVALTIAVTACSALALSLTASLQHTDATLDGTIARGLAEQLVDEVLGQRYTGDDPYSTVFGPDSWEQAGAARERYNDTDDYHGVRSSPPTDAWGVALGSDDGEGGTRHPSFTVPVGLLNRWSARLEVYYVSDSDPSVRLPAGQASSLRAVEATVYESNAAGGEQLLARVRRVVSYVPGY